MVGDKIKQLIDNQQVMNRHEVAEKMGISENNLYRLYKRESVETKYLLCLCDMFSISIDYFFNNESPVIENTKIATKISSKKDDSPMVEELKATNEFLKEELQYFKDLVKQQFQMLNTKLDNLGKKHSGIGVSQQGNLQKLSTNIIN
jgi:DNA-binding Xre family transcriptional regulator